MYSVDVYRKFKLAWPIKWKRHDTFWGDLMKSFRKHFNFLICTPKNSTPLRRSCWGERLERWVKFPSAVSREGKNVGKIQKIMSNKLSLKLALDGDCVRGEEWDCPVYTIHEYIFYGEEGIELRHKSPKNTLFFDGTIKIGVGSMSKKIFI